MTWVRRFASFEVGVRIEHTGIKYIYKRVGRKRQKKGGG